MRHKHGRGVIARVIVVKEASHHVHAIIISNNNK